MTAIPSALSPAHSPATGEPSLRLTSPFAAREGVVPHLKEMLPAFVNTGPVTQLESQLETVQAELDSLRSEFEIVRRRDETLNFYMHRLDEELRLAARLQQDFLPKSLPELGPIRFHSLFRPAGYVSGDLFDVMRLDEKRIGFYVADAVGHGMPAALLTMFVKQALVTKDILPKSVAPCGYRLLDPGEALSRLNETMVEQGLTHASFCTALYGIIDVETLQLTLAKAGHPEPILMRADGSHEMLVSDGCLLGIFPGEQFAVRQVQLTPGDRMIVYTDGIEVAFPDSDVEHFPPRWQHEMLARRAMPAEQLLADFSSGLDDISGSLNPRDDLTMLTIDVLK